MQTIRLRRFCCSVQTEGYTEPAVGSGPVRPVLVGSSRWQKFAWMLKPSMLPFTESFHSSSEFYFHKYSAEETGRFSGFGSDGMFLSGRVFTWTQCLDSGWYFGSFEPTQFDPNFKWTQQNRNLSSWTALNMKLELKSETVLKRDPSRSVLSGPVLCPVSLCNEL